MPSILGARHKTESGEANYRNPIEAALKLRASHGQWFKASDRSLANPKPWPPGFDPKTAPVFAHNEVEVPLPPSKVFAALTAAKGWPEFFPNATDIKMPKGKDALELGTKFEFSTFGAKQKTQVVEYEKDKALAWDAKSPGNEAYHRWILEPTANGGTKIITEEIQRGPTAEIDHKLMNPALNASHQLWLETMKGHLLKDTAGWAPR
jgi:uncharacterized protein YndB with AHSA1/START domain